MSDRPRSQQPDSNEDDDLAYLDAGLREPVDDDSPTEAIDEPVARTSQQAAPPEATERVDADASPAPQTTVVVTPPPARDRSWTWPLINAAGLAVVILVNFLANALEFNGLTTGEVIDRDPVPFQPEGWVFTIWGVIYALLLVFVIYGLLPAGRHNVRLQRISPLFLLANVANVTWLFLWHWEQFLPSLVTILVLLGSLLGIYIGLRITNPLRRSGPDAKPGWFRRLVLWVPFSVYLGWTVVASLANLMVWLDRDGWDGGPFSYNTWAVLFMVAGALVAGAFVVTARDALIPLVLAVAYVGIADHNWGGSALVSISAIVFAVVCAGLAGVAWLLAFDRDTDRGPFNRRMATDTPPPMTHVDDPPTERP